MTYGTNTRGEDKCTYLWPETGIEYGIEPTENEKAADQGNQSVGVENHPHKKFSAKGTFFKKNFLSNVKR